MFDSGGGFVILGRWLLIETLGHVDTWSLLAVGTAPREWKSFQRAVSTRLQPLVATAYTTGTSIDQQLPQSRHNWSGQRILVVPLHGPDDRVHAVRLWVGTGDPPPPVGVAAFGVDARARRIEAIPYDLGPHFEHDRIVWIGAESFELIERFDGALDLVATLARSAPGDRWLDTATVRARTGPRTLLLAARNPDENRYRWLGLAVDVTDSVAPQRKSFEAATLDLLRGAQPNLYLAIVDLAQVRLIRWVTEPVPGLRWGRGTDERTVPHPADRDRIILARNDIRSGVERVTLTGMRLATDTGDWLVADLEASPLPGGTTGTPTPEFALVQLDIIERPQPG
ncbi:GAF domain-containing protein [Nocardia sp. CA-128927]|uniref:GAF domain-containing protein n=1 Tax=Nocardia sp. CA-128927 TaxID=3239975 RepID=UPI003D952195